ncbi:MAG: hypothetical protein KH381_01990 [Clostridium sp.]|nr:hypothetical protein [Clostridium sp.]
MEKASGISKKETDYAAAEKRVDDLTLNNTEKMIMLARLLEDPFCRHMVSHARPDMNYLNFTVGEKEIKISSLDELYELSSDVVRDIMLSDECKVDMKKYMPTIEEE